MEKGMDRMQRVGPVRFDRTGTMDRACPGIGVGRPWLAIGTAAPTARPRRQALGQSMSVPCPNALRLMRQEGDTLLGHRGVFSSTPGTGPEIWYVNPQSGTRTGSIRAKCCASSTWTASRRVTVDRRRARWPVAEVRSEPLAQAIRVVPYDVIEKFVGRPSLLDRRLVNDAPHIVGFRSKHLVGSTENEAYGTGLGAPAARHHVHRRARRRRTARP